MQNYLCWARAASTGDIQQIDPTAKPSINGVPFCHWSPGPGLMVAPFYWSMKAVDEQTSDATIIKIAGGFYSLCFWWLAFQCFIEMGFTRQSSVLALLILICCTAVGYYSLALGSESLSLLPVGILLLQTIRFVNSKPQNWIAIGCATALLVMNRPYLVPFAGPALLGLLFEFRKRPLYLAPHLSVAIPVGLGLMVMMAHHYWMTGHALKSPYSFGDSQFQSLNLSEPQFLMNVLLDPFHGVLSTHPFIGVGLLAFIVAGFNAAKHRHWRMVLAVGAGLIAVGINVWFVSSWYYWWLGIPHLANRGVVLPGIPATIGFLFWLHHSKRPWIPLATLLACLAWSLPHQLMGPTHYETWGRLWEGQVGRYYDLLTSSDAVVWGLSAVVAGLMVLLSTDDPKSQDLLKPVPLGLIALIASTILFLHTRTGRSWSPSLVPISLAIATVYGFLVSPRKPPDPQVSYQSAPLTKVFVGLGPTALLLSILFFVPMAWNTTGTLSRPDEYVSFYYSDAEGGMRFIAASDRADFQALASHFRAFCERQGLEFRPPLDRPTYTYELARQIQANPSLFTLFKGD